MLSWKKRNKEVCQLMMRQKIRIDTDRCSGCGLCVNACKEGSLQLIDGKAKLVHAAHCDGLGRCLSLCPADAITFEPVEDDAPCGDRVPPSALRQWPLQIRLVNPQAPFLQNAQLLIAADCAAYAYKNFHEDYMRDRIVLIGCPKLDDADYAKKLEKILDANDIQSLTVVRMEVPCCAGLVTAVEDAIQAGEKTVPCEVVTLSLDGRALDESITI